MTAAPFPAPDATFTEIAAWKRQYDGQEARTVCECGHMRAQHDGPDRGRRCNARGCDCKIFDDAPHEAPRVEYGPSLMCNACQRVRVRVGKPFCSGCLLSRLAG